MKKLNWALLGVVWSGVASGQVRVEETVVVASRYQLERAQIGNWVDVLDRGDYEDEGWFTMEEAVRSLPGAVVASNGQAGTLSSIFMRGAESDHTQLRVDGMRVTDANLTPSSFLGGLQLGGFDRMEVIRGPQSALYGSGAIGGVISLGLDRGTGEPAARTVVEAGSFGSVRGRQEFSGEAKGLGYNLQLGYGETENDLPANRFDWQSAALRLDYDLTATRQVGMTLRVNEREIELGASGAQSDDSVLTTVFWTEEWSPDFETTMRVGYLEHDQETSFGTAELDRLVGSLDGTHAWGERGKTLFGVEWEDSGYEATSGSLHESNSLWALYLQQEWQWREFTVLAGGRWEDYSDFGDEFTGRLAVAWDHQATGTVVRASLGSGFRAPSFIDAVGFFPGFPGFFPDYFGNPAVGPERTVGWDFGVEQTVAGDHTLAVAFFANEIEDLIVGATDPVGGFSTVANVEKAETWGIETTLRGSWCEEQWRYRLAYTYLEATNESAGTRLLRRPRHTFSATVSGEPVAWWTVGAGVYLIADRKDLSNTDFSEIDGEDYTVARLFTTVRVNERLSISGRVENLFDEDYDEVDGFPGRGTGAFAGVTLTW